MNQAAQLTTFEATIATITPAEAKVIILLQQGYTNRQIGLTLFRSELTIKTHVEHILAKTGAKNRAQICVLWARNQSNNFANQPQYTPNGVLGVVNATGNIDARSSGSNIDKGSKMRSLNTSEIIVVGGGLDFPPPFIPGGPAWPSTPPLIVATELPPLPQQWELREYLSPDDIWPSIQ